MLHLYMRRSQICLNWELANDAITEAVKGEFLPHRKVDYTLRGPAFAKKMESLSQYYEMSSTPCPQNKQNFKIMLALS